MANNQSMTTFKAIEPYQLYEGGNNFNEIELSTSYWKGHGIVVSVYPIEHKGWMISRTIMGTCPEEEGLRSVAVVRMARFNRKQLENVHADLVGMGDKIADLWNKRDFDGIKALFS